MTEYRPALVAPLYRQGEKRLVSDPAVRKHPEFWMALLPIEEVTDAKQE